MKPHCHVNNTSLYKSSFPTAKQTPPSGLFYLGLVLGISHSSGVAVSLKWLSWGTTGQESMGRLDDAAKRKVVELRKAGLSFRKIKAVLELENIKVSAQAIYLFLREFHGRPPGRVRPEEAASSTSPTQVQARAGVVSQVGRRDGWSNIHLHNLLREASHHVGFTAAAEFSKQTASSPETTAKPSESGQSSGGGRAEQQQEANKEENDIQIVSVTSLAQNSQQRGLQSPVTAAGAGSTTVAVAGAFTRRRVTPSPATNPVLAARRRLLDKALSHRAKVTTYILFL